MITEWWLSRTYYKRQKAHTCVRPNETRMKGEGGKDKAYGKHVDEQCRINILAAESPTKERKKQREASVRGVADPCLISFVLALGVV